MELGEPDESGRRRPLPVPGSEFLVDADTVVFALGFGVDAAVSKSADLQADDWGQVIADEESGATSRAGVFTAGDCAHGADLVVTAIAGAKRAAAGIHRFLTEEHR